ncbi:MAG: TonB-dependent receptor [Acidobacteria bacterium]|nr:TonB-dependent receptor [Acidobacteriota bacterium]
MKGFGLAVLLFLTITAVAQSSATLQGTVVDQSGAVVASARVIVRNQATGLERTVQTDNSGNYQVAALPVGTYRIEVQGQGFTPQVVTDLTLEVSRIVVQNFQLKVGGVTQEVSVTAGSQTVETATMTVGQVINQKTVQEIPLNGRHFVDLGLLIPGSVTPPQSGFLTAPLRGQGSFAFNTAGAREDTVNFMINGINLNDMVQNQITFQPSINTVQEFKVDNSTYSAEYGRNSGAIVNIATRSGTNAFHGEGFEFLRNDALDARNFFDGPNNPPFKRNQFGAALGGPIKKDRAFFFFSYEGLRQRQGITLNRGVLSTAERAGVTDPVSRRLLDFIPPANATDNAGNPIFVGSGTAPVDLDQWTGDVSYNLSENDRVHGYYAIQRDKRGEPVLQGNTIPNFGDTRTSRRQIFTLNETHTFGPNLVNEARLGFNRIFITFNPNATINPRDLGINNGINEPIGLPQITITGLGLNFGGPNGFPQGRGDTAVAFSDTLSYSRGKHGFKFGGEFRRFYNNNFSKTPGTFTFANTAAFQAGTANAFTVTLGDVTSSIATGALGFYTQDSYKVKSNLTLELGLRYDWFTTPTERYDRFVVFDESTGSLPRIGTGRDLIYEQNNRNIQPRIGFAWDPFRDGKTSIRGGYSILADQPVTNLVTPTSSNPPLATPLTFTGTIGFGNAASIAGPSSVAPSSVDPNFKNAYVQSYNLNIQREITPTTGIMVGYFGSKGTHLRISRNLNQFINGVRRFSGGNITEITSAGNSNYNALWVSGNKRLSKGLQFNASYTLSKSFDYNSLNSQGIVIQNSYDLANDYGLSAFDARHRFVINWIYELPFKGNRLFEGWQVSGITQWQTGNPITILSGNAVAIAGTTFPLVNSTTLTGVATIRPDLTGNVEVIGRREQWFTNIVCDPRSPATCPAGAPFTIPITGSVFHFGNLGRSTITGPGFSNTDFSLLKNIRFTESTRIQFRAEVFDIFNHANFGQPGNVAQRGSTTFGVINNTRFPTGDSGSSRQVQLALKLIF